MAYKKSAINGEYMLGVLDSGSIEVYRVYDNTKGALREIAELENFEYDPNWNTRQFGDGKEASVGCYNIYLRDSGTVEVYRTYDNVKGALREVAEKEGFVFDPAWNTRQFGSKLIDFLTTK